MIKYLSNMLNVVNNVVNKYYKKIKSNNMTTIKKGSTGDEVKVLQRYLGVGADGIFGDKTYAAVVKWQQEHGLVADGIVGPQTWAALTKEFGSMPSSTTTPSSSSSSSSSSTDDIKIVKMPLSVHVSKASNRPIKYIALHYTAGGSSKAGSARAVKRVFEKRSASADFAVDDADIVQFNPDLRNYYCWSVGDKKNPYSSGGSLYRSATNKNTISIEMCSNLQRGTSASAANHPGWSLTDATVDNAVKLTKYLMKKFNIPLSHVVRHYDISGKLCPGVPGWNNEQLYDTAGKRTNQKNNSKEWEEFKSRLV